MNTQIEVDHYHEIERLIFNYADYIDSGDFESVAELFEHGQICGSPGLWCNRGYDKVLKMNQRSVKLHEGTGTPCTKHVVSNLKIEISKSSDAASAKSYFTVFQSLPDFPLQAIISGCYHDTFLNSEGQWRFRERNIVSDFFGDLSHHLNVELSE
jgi:3-phenylpropionate/cinnamic acid dioxygenase small subunit